MVAWEITNFSITNGTSIVELPVSVDENLDQVEKKLNKLFTSLRSKYYLFVSDPVVEGIDALENNKATIRISAETILAKVPQVHVLLEKKHKNVYSRRHTHAQPLFTQYSEEQSKS